MARGLHPWHDALSLVPLALYSDWKARWRGFPFFAKRQPPTRREREGTAHTARAPASGPKRGLSCAATHRAVAGRDESRNRSFHSLSTAIG